MNLLNKLPFVLCLIFATGIVLSSCGDGDEEPAGEAPKVKFIGDYSGEVTCPGILNTVLSDPTLNFDISNASPEADNRVQVNLPSLPIMLNLVGTVSGNNVTMDETTEEGVSLPFGGAEIMANIAASGDGKLVGNTLTATIYLIGTTPSGAALADDTCTIIANKQ